MFYPVTVHEKSGSIQVVDSEALSDRHWGIFEELEESRKTKNDFVYRVKSQGKRKQVSKFLRFEQAIDKLMTSDNDRRQGIHDIS